jgi:uncharacterized membrane protein HdeD (DUF308 family)
MKRRNWKPGVLTILSGAAMGFLSGVIFLICGAFYNMYYRSEELKPDETGLITLAEGYTVQVGTRGDYLWPMAICALFFVFALYLIAQGLLTMRRSVTPDRKKWRIPKS